MDARTLTAAPAPSPDRALTAPGPTSPGPGAPAPGSPPVGDAVGDPSMVDLTDAVAPLVGDDDAGEGPWGPWVRMRPRARAEAAPGGRPAGPLQRMVVAVKDLVAVGGLPLGAGTAARADAPPEPRDAEVVAVLRRAGAVVAGTVALHELAFGVTGINDALGFPAHPVDASRIPGGSSSGSAVAVATGAVHLAVGTDTGGSVRIPAALCGVVGFKPGRARYPTDGVMPLAPTLDRVGLLTPSVSEIAVAHRMITGDRVATRMPQRLGVDVAALHAADPTVAAAVEAALHRLHSAGCTLIEVRWPDPAEVLDVSTTILFAEAAAVHHAVLDGGGPVGVDVAARLARGAALTAADHREARATARRLAAAVRQALDQVDAVVGPTVPVAAPPIDEARENHELPATLVSCTRLANVCEVPALTVPVAGEALPVGLQVLAATDVAALGVGAAIAPLVGPA